MEESKKGTVVKKAAMTHASKTNTTAAHTHRVAAVQARLNEYGLPLSGCKKQRTECLWNTNRDLEGQAWAMLAAAIVVVTYASHNVLEIAMAWLGRLCFCIKVVQKQLAMDCGCVAGQKMEFARALPNAHSVGPLAPDKLPTSRTHQLEPNTGGQ